MLMATGYAPGRKIRDMRHAKPSRRYARRRVADILLEPDRSTSLWRNRMGRLYLAAPHGRTSLVLGPSARLKAPDSMAWGLYHEADQPGVPWLNGPDGLVQLETRPASLIDAYGPWVRLNPRIGARM